MDNVMTNGFCELNEKEMIMVEGGTDWGKKGYELGYNWCKFWMGVGAGIYDATH